MVTAAQGPAAYVLAGTRTAIGTAFTGTPARTSAYELAETVVEHELRRRGGRYGVAALCAGGGMGSAVVVEAV